GRQGRHRHVTRAANAGRSAAGAAWAWTRGAAAVRDRTAGARHHRGRGRGGGPGAGRAARRRRDDRFRGQTERGMKTAPRAARFLMEPYAIWLAAKSQFTRFQYASTYLARALR